MVHVPDPAVRNEPPVSMPVPGPLLSIGRSGASEPTVGGLRCRLVATWTCRRLTSNCSILRCRTTARPAAFQVCVFPTGHTFAHQWLADEGKRPT
jgi:hypothetical protein